MILKTAKHTAKLTYKAQYDTKHKREALEALNNIQKTTHYVLTKRTKSMIKEYAREILGSTRYAYWLYVYAAYNRNFVEGWIPDNYFGYVVAPRANKGIGRIANVKTLSRRILDCDLLPDKFYLIDGIFYDLEFNIVDPNDVRRVVNSVDKELYVKSDNSNQGRGVMRITKDNFDLQAILDIGDAVIQEPIIQSKWFNKIIEGSVATIRVTTAKGSDGEVQSKAAYLRVGRRDSQVVQSSTAIKVPIIDQIGTLGDFGVGPNWEQYPEHPDSGFAFAGQLIPNFPRAIAECERLHRKLPNFAIIGWDVSITEDGEVRIIEWNAGHPDIKFSEATTGPCFSDLGWEDIWKTQQ